MIHEHPTEFTVVNINVLDNWITCVLDLDGERLTDGVVKQSKLVLSVERCRELGYCIGSKFFGTIMLDERGRYIGATHDFNKENGVVRVLTTHKTNECNEALTITVLDDPGQGGANNEYLILSPVGLVSTLIKFQNGPMPVNGLTNEALLAIVEDRLEGFQRGPYACIYTGIALGAVTLALLTLGIRTKDRTVRGVEGTHAK
jgi:hypothetical protein